MDRQTKKLDKSQLDGCTARKLQLDRGDAGQNEETLHVDGNKTINVEKAVKGNNTT